VRGRPPLSVVVVLVAVALALTGCSSGEDDEAAASDARVVQLGAPGEPNRELSPEEIEALEPPEASEEDVAFVQGMVPHHEQALQMTSLVPDRAANERIVLFAERMDISQKDEIRLMQDWLVARGDIFGEDGHHNTGELMPGMLTEEEMAELRAAEGEEFDRLFLEGMIKHHLGAIQMVEDLLGSDGGGSDPEIFQLAQHIDSDQRIEIDRMQQLLAETG
jgi:uncharacterized protein (DUF305 family)